MFIPQFGQTVTLGTKAGLAACPTTARAPGEVLVERKGVYFQVPATWKVGTRVPKPVSPSRQRQKSVRGGRGGGAERSREGRKVPHMARGTVCPGKAADGSLCLLPASRHPGSRTKVPKSPGAAIDARRSGLYLPRAVPWDCPTGVLCAYKPHVSPSPHSQKPRGRDGAGGGGSISHHPSYFPRLQLVRHPLTEEVGVLRNK